MEQRVLVFMRILFVTDWTYTWLMLAFRSYQWWVQLKNKERLTETMNRFLRQHCAYKTHAMCGWNLFLLFHGALSHTGPAGKVWSHFLTQSLISLSNEFSVAVAAASVALVNLRSKEAASLPIITLILFWAGPAHHLPVGLGTAIIVQMLWGLWFSSSFRLRTGNDDVVFLLSILTNLWQCAVQITFSYDIGTASAPDSEYFLCHTGFYLTVYKLCATTPFAVVNILSSGFPRSRLRVIGLWLLIDVPAFAVLSLSCTDQKYVLTGTSRSLIENWTALYLAPRIWHAFGAQSYAKDTILF